MSTVSAVSVKLPPFWTTNVKAWFLQVETQCSLWNIVANLLPGPAWLMTHYPFTTFSSLWAAEERERGYMWEIRAGNRLCLSTWIYITRSFPVNKAVWFSTQRCSHPFISSSHIMSTILSNTNKVHLMRLFHRSPLCPHQMICIHVFFSLPFNLSV